MLQQISLKNFKPFADMPLIRLAPITLVYGPNSGGKSSLIQSLLLLRQSLEKPSDSRRPAIVRGDYADLGSFQSLIHRHELSRDLTIGVAFDRNKESREKSRYLPPSRRLLDDGLRFVELTYRASTQIGSKKRNSSDLVGVLYQLRGERGFRVHLKKVPGPTGNRGLADFTDASDSIAVYEWAGSSDDQSIRHYLERNIRDRLAKVETDLAAAEARLSEAQDRGDDQTKHSAKRFVSLSNHIRYLQTRKQRDEMLLTNIAERLADSRVIAFGPLPSEIAIPEGLNNEPVMSMSSLGAGLVSPLSALVHEFSELIATLRYLGPLRSYPARHYLVKGVSSNTVGRSGEYTPQLLHRDGNNVQKRTNHWFEQFEIPYRLKTRQLGDEVIGEILAMSLVDLRTNVSVSPTDVGFGVGQLLPILVEGVVAKRAIICVEQPEIHLHPRLQASVADFLIDTARLSGTLEDGSNPDGNQWIVETHSEALMLRLQRRIRERRLAPQDVAVLYVEPTSNGATVTSLELDESGNFLCEWPGGFFEEGYHELLD